MSARTAACNEANSPLLQFSAIDPVKTPFLYAGYIESNDVDKYVNGNSRCLKIKMLFPYDEIFADRQKTMDILEEGRVVLFSLELLGSPECNNVLYKISGLKIHELVTKRFSDQGTVSPEFVFFVSSNKIRGAMQEIINPLPDSNIPYSNPDPDLYEKIAYFAYDFHQKVVKNENFNPSSVLPSPVSPEQLGLLRSLSEVPPMGSTAVDLPRNVTVASNNKGFFASISSFFTKK